LCKNVQNQSRSPERGKKARMRLAKITIENFRCFGYGDSRFELELNRGLTALVGENDGGKSAVIDAIRLALGTTDQHWERIEDEDFHAGAQAWEIRIACEFVELNDQEKRTFLEFLTYGENPGDAPLLFVTWAVEDRGEIRRGRPYRRPEVRCGRDGQGPSLPPEVREFLRTTYLRPLRNARQSLSAGRGSRLSQVLQHTEHIDATRSIDEDTDFREAVTSDALGILDIGLVANRLLLEQRGVVDARSKIDSNLSDLALRGDELRSSIEVGGEADADEIRLRRILEKLDLSLEDPGVPGLGSSNLLFMACELLLLAQEDVGARLLLIEEPEAHLHPQRQLRVMRFLQDQAMDLGIQVVVTTHSPNIASAIRLENVVMIRKPYAFSMAERATMLDQADYRFLERFLDVTKANLFFARGVLIVEGPSEAILLPTLAGIIGRDLAEYGVSVVNVGGAGLRRYARIFQRRSDQDPALDIPVACLADMDVMPNCAPRILDLLQADGTSKPRRRWKMKADFECEGTGESLEERRARIRCKAAGQAVETFVSDEWTLEYDLALGGLADDVYVAACMAEADDELNSGQVTREEVEESSLGEFGELRHDADAVDGCSVDEVVASKVYFKFFSGRAPKPIAAQYLAERLRTRHEEGDLPCEELLARLPKYLIHAIEHVTEPLGEATE